ncbi:MAG: hypothetical protein MUE98_08100 [Rhodobacteraceae bacterium]|jgi:hypothetical protein|nr:hypothetical protein [Paracoccaceae bacterium]
MPDPVLATLHPSPPRRWVAILLLAGLGGFLVWTALARPPEALGWRVFLLLVGAGAVYLADRLRRATEVHLVLTRQALADSAGRVLARVDDIRAVHSGTFAVKPSSGFTLRLAASGGSAWEPGLWWRIGSRVGVGGVTAGREGRYMAEVLQVMLSERRGGSEDR